MANDSEPESLPEFSASEDEWNPEQEEKKTSFKAAPPPAKRKKQPAAVKKLPTRASRRIASKLWKELPREKSPEPVAELPPEVEVETPDSSDGEEEVVPKKRRQLPAAKGARSRRGKVKKEVAVVAKEDSIKLTTFTVEELYRKYRPDLAEPAKAEKVKVKKKVKEERVDDGDDDDESSGDDYLVDPDELDLNSEFFNSVTSKDGSKEGGAVKFDCNAGMSVEESEDDDEEEDKPLSSVKGEQQDSTEFNKKLIQQINQSSQDCMTMVKLVEVSKRIEREREEMDLLRRKREQKEVKREEDVSNLLLTGEKIKGKVVKHSGRSDFVAVDGVKKERDREKSVEITLKFESAEQNGRHGKKKIDLLTAIKRMMNREKRQNQIYLHKVSILCWIGHGTFLNRTLSNASLIKAINKRLLPSTTNCRPKGLTNLHYFEQVTRYFRKAVRLKNHVMYFRPPNSAKLPPLSATLKYQILQRAAFSKRDFILLYLLMLRSLSIHCRLIISLPVPPKHVPTSDLYRMNPQTRDELEADRRLLLDFRRAHLAPKGSTIRKVKSQLTTMVDKTVEARRKEAARKRRREGFCATIPQLDGGHDLLPPEPKPRKQMKLMENSFLEIEQNIARKLQGKVKPAKKQQNDKQVPFPDELDEQVRARREKILAAYKASKEQKAAAAAAKAAQEEFCGEGSSSSPKKGRRPKRNVTRAGIDLWVEVYCEHEDKWVTVDVITGKVHCLEHTVNQASQPISYVLAWNNDGSMKDVSPRYISRLGTKKSKLRVEDGWLERALADRNGRRRRPTRRDRTEDLKFDKLLNKRPFPEQIAEYKNHPRFAIQRHLLKNEAIYPRDAVVLGHIKGEPIYPRDCVHLLFSREGWLRQAKTVRMHEKPYKVVTRKAKYDRVTGTTVTGLNTELFGEWQVQDYEPPVAQNGQVPRSAYGNVELFKPCMLPKGTVHLQLPGLNKICKRLHVDCAPAITGFEYRNNACAAVYDGYVVCEEFRDVVLDEWYQEQVEEQRKQEEKRLKRIYGNWKRLVAGLFIRKKLKDRYNFDNM